MAVEVIMPKVDMDMTSGKVMTWHAGEGERVKKGSALFVIETDKAAMEIESETDGYLHHRVPDGTEVAIGSPVAWIYAEGEEVGEAPTSSMPVPAFTSAIAPPVVGIAEDRRSQGKFRATPHARALAREAGIDISTVRGTGPRGRVQGSDLQALLNVALSPDPPTPVRLTPETGSLSVTHSGTSGGTPVVLIHGFASDALSWAPLEKHLNHRPLIRIELPAHGKSPRLAIRNFAALAAEIRHSFDEMPLEEAHVVGHSLGGALALALADVRPRKIASLTLIAAAGLGPEINGASLRGICSATRAESLAPWLKTLVADETLVTERFVRLVMAGRADPRLRAAQAMLRDVLFPDGVQAFDLRAALARIEVPTRIVWGKRDEIIPWQHALRAPGHVALHLFDALGHVPQFEAPGVVGRLFAAQP